MTSNITFRFAGDAAPLKRASKDAQDSLSGIMKAGQPVTGSFGKIGSSLTEAFSPAKLTAGPVAAVAAMAAVAAAAKAVFDTLLEGSKAFFDDQKAIIKVDMALQNNTNLTYEQMKAVNAQIDSLSMLTAVQDDQLRQSYANLVTSTGDAEKSMQLLTLATDISAGSGLGLEKVSKALAKAYNGSDTALRKMIPGFEGGTEGIAKLQSQFEGMGAALGNVSPFERMAIAMDQVKEAFGTILAPLLVEFSTWLTSDDFQIFLTTFVEGMASMGKMLFEVMQPLLDVLDRLKDPAVMGVILAIPGMQFLFHGEESLFGGKEGRSSIDDFTKSILDAAKGLKGLKINFEDMDEGKPLEIAQRIKDAAKQIADSGEKFKAAINFGEFIDKDTKIFDSAKFMEKFQGIIAAAKALPGKLKALRKAGASPEVLQQILAMGPEQGLAVAQGFLSNAGSAKEYSNSLNTLSMLGQKSAAQTASSNTYEINVNKANMTAEEIIAVIQKYERKTGKKVNFGG